MVATLERDGEVVLVVDQPRIDPGRVVRYFSAVSREPVVGSIVSVDGQRFKVVEIAPSRLRLCHHGE